MTITTYVTSQSLAQYGWNIGCIYVGRCNRRSASIVHEDVVFLLVYTIVICQRVESAGWKGYRCMMTRLQFVLCTSLCTGCLSGCTEAPREEFAGAGVGISEEKAREEPKAEEPKAEGAIVPPITHGGMIKAVDGNHLECVATEMGVAFYFTDGNLQPRQLPCRRTNFGCPSVSIGAFSERPKVEKSSFEVHTPLQNGAQITVTVTMQMNEHLKSWWTDFELVVGHELPDLPIRHGGTVLPIGDGGFVEHVADKRGHHLWLTDAHGHPDVGMSSTSTITLDDGTTRESSYAKDGEVLFRRLNAASKNVSVEFGTNKHTVDFPAIP